LSDQGLSDETLLERLAGDNLELRKQLKALLGSETFGSGDAMGASSTTDPSPTKH